MAIDGIRGAGISAFGQRSFQARDALQGGTYKLTNEQAQAMKTAKDIYGKDMSETYTKPAMEAAEKAITEWINKNPTASREKLDQAIKDAIKTAIEKQQTRKLGDDHFMNQIVAKIGQALKFKNDAFED